MTAYFVAHGTTKDPEKLARYIEAAAPIVESFGGRYIAAGMVSAVLLGRHEHTRTALFSFPDTAACRGWFESEIYRGLWPLRSEAADFVFLVFEDGLPPQPAT